MFKYVLVAVFCVACCTPAKPTPQPLPAPPLVDDAGVPLDPCARACRHLRALRCLEGAHTTAGATCETVCRTGLPPNGGIDPKCLQTVRTCDEEATCTVK